MAAAEFEADRGFSQIQRFAGYLPIEGHGLIGDGRGAALVGRDGGIPWMCVPRFDSPPLFCGLLDRIRGGSFTVAPDGLIESRQQYIEDTAVLITELRTATGLIRLTDAMLLRSGADLREDAAACRGELLRKVEMLHGRVELEVGLRPRGGCSFEPHLGGVRLRAPRHPGLELGLWASRPIEGPLTRWTMDAGDSATLVLAWERIHRERHLPLADAQLEETVATWKGWASHLRYEGPQKTAVRRSALTLKLLDHFENGAIIAAPTSSLPEAVGGPRNWDYRYAWIRDAALSVYALRRIGMTSEADGFLEWVLEAFEHSGRPRVLYDVDGRMPPAENLDSELEGYRHSQPVRWGNAAAEQRQHDVYGEILDCAYQAAAGRTTLDPVLWARLSALADAAAQDWRVPDHGIWEVRTARRPFTYSAALCHVALDRAVRLAESLGLGGDVARWRTGAAEIAAAILNEAWDPRQSALSEHIGGGNLDASLLALPLRRVIPADHPRMIATTEAIRRRLGAGNGLLFRYLPRDSPDGLPGTEGTFLLCSFWLVDNLALQGRHQEAMDSFASICQRAGPLGLLPEQIDPSTGGFLGNYPQALSHVGLIASGVLLDRLAQGDRFRTSYTALAARSSPPP
jgi:GH15 family glucan-1,4-alpha-glucosidase